MCYYLQMQWIRPQRSQYIDGTVYLSQSYWSQFAKPVTIYQQQQLQMFVNLSTLRFHPPSPSPLDLGQGPMTGTMSPCSLPLLPSQTSPMYVCPPAQSETCTGRKSIFISTLLQGTDHSVSHTYVRTLTGHQWLTSLHPHDQ